MIDVSNIKIRALHVHRVGNRLRSEEVIYSEHAEKLPARDLGTIGQFLFGHAERLNTFKFEHPVDEKLNTIFSITQSIAQDTDTLGDASQQIATHLYSVSNHPKVKAGNLYVGIFDGIVIEGKASTVLGIFKSDAVNPFVKIEAIKNWNGLKIDYGAPITSLDKMALVILSPKARLFSVLSACARGDDTVYWNERFLQVVPTSSPKAKTRAYLDACRAFASQTDHDMSEAERSLFLNRSLQYFESADHFDEKKFSSVFSNKAEEKAFSKFKAANDVDGDGQSTSDFAIEKAVVRKERAKFERNLRLDSHIEIRLKFKDQKEMEKRVEQGFDDLKGLPFIKLYYSAD